MGGFIAFLIAAGIAVWDLASGHLLFAGTYAAVAALIVGMHRVQRLQKIRELYDDDLWAKFTKSWPNTIAAGEYIRDTYGKDQLQRLLHDPEIQRYILDIELSLRPGTTYGIHKKIDAVAQAAGIRKVAI